jgi:hypothetical protein
MLSAITNEIACIERNNNTIDAHVECGSFRMMQDNKDLSIILKALENEKIFKEDNINVRKILNGKIIHQKIVENIIPMCENGSERMYSFIQERYIDHSINIDDPLKAMIRYKLSDSYVPDDGQQPKRKINKNTLINDTIKSSDNFIKDTISLSFFRVSFSPYRYLSLKVSANTK